jgi:hypothetical protein
MSGVILGGETPPLCDQSIYNLPMTKFDPQKHPFDHAQGRHRRSIRLQNYDYSQEGAYFVTIVTWQRECLLGQIVDKEMILSRYGEIVQKWWDEIPVHFLNVETGVFVIMPNHIHGIIYILDGRGTVSVPKDDGEIDVPEIPVPKDDGENTIPENNDMSGENLGGETQGGKTQGGVSPPLYECLMETQHWDKSSHTSNINPRRK